MEFSHRFFLLVILSLTHFASLSIAHIQVTEHGIDVFFDDQPEQTKVDIQYSHDLTHWLPQGEALLELPEGGHVFSDELDEGFKFYRLKQTSHFTKPVLIVLLDFSDTQFPANVVHPERSHEDSWAQLMFGLNQGEGNHYWNEVSYGIFQMQAASESYGIANNGVIYVQLEEAAPTSERYKVEDQTWIPDALDKVSEYMDLPAYDSNADGVISNQELSILFVINLPFSRISGAGAQANIRINHVVDGVEIEKFTRTLSDYSSIGVNVHELGHHIFNLDHGQDASGTTMMGTGAYNEDPTITKFTSTYSKWGTRPAHLSADSKIRAGFVEPMAVGESLTQIPLYTAVSPHYNVVRLPALDGYVLIENRTQEGYDTGLPFAEGHSGGLIATKVVEFRRFLRTNPDVLSYDFADYYRFKDYQDEFTIGGYRIYNISDPGEQMTFDIEKLDIAPAIVDYRYDYWITDPNRVGYRMLDFLPGNTEEIDFNTYSLSESPEGRYYTINLKAIYNTGDIITVNHLAEWESSDPYLNLQKGMINYGTDAIIRFNFDTSQPYVDRATLSVQYEDYQHELVITNLPDLTNP